jgi:acyl phosphate:glycerol-3-phosphate acyltransferase
VSALLVKALLAYLLGSVIGSLVIGRIRGVDIRSMGSGNPGATNALRTQGMKVGLTVLAIDMFKGWFGTAVLASWSLSLGQPVDLALTAWSAPVCGIAVILGHLYPVWFGFRGGKGVATLVGAVSGISARLLLVFAATWLAAVILLGFVGLASMLGAVAVVIASAVGDYPARTPLMVFALVAAVLIIYTHRANIARMRAGTEPKAKRLWLLGTRRSG